VHVVLPLLVTTARVNVVLLADAVLPMLSATSCALHTPLTGGFANFHHHNAPTAPTANKIAKTIHSHCSFLGFVACPCVTIMPTRLYSQVYTKRKRFGSWYDKTMDNEHQHTLTTTPNLPITHPKLKDYVPLLSVFAVIIFATLAICSKVGFTADNLLGYSMGFFFLIFGLFKLLDIGMFAMGYREYDIIAKNIPAWGYIYPFVELGLAGLYLAGDVTANTLNITIVLSVITVISVWIKLAKRELVQCVCLGNVLRVPLTYVSLIEYAAMAAMAIAMLVI
jgi:hypothetical protein